MSTQINEQLFKNFFIKTVGSDKISHNKAKELHIENDKFEGANDNDNNYLEIDEVMDNKDLYEMFATMYVEEMEKDKDKADEENEKNKKQHGYTPVYASIFQGQRGLYYSFLN